MKIGIAGYRLGDKAVADNVTTSLVGEIEHLNGNDSESTLDIFVFVNGRGDVTFEQICRQYQVSMDENTQIIHVTGASEPTDNTERNYHVINTLNDFDGFTHWGIIHVLEQRRELSEFSFERRPL